METILLINDGLPGTVNASKFAFFIAQKMQANVLLANLFDISKPVETKTTIEHAGDHTTEMPMPYLGDYLEMLNNRPNDFEPKIKEIDISVMDENQVAQIINRNDIWMVVKSVPGSAMSGISKENLNVSTILNRIRCPLMLVPETWPIKNIERMAYLTDLRYCRLQIVRYLAEIAKPCCADLSIAHISADDMPDIDECYAANLFNNEIYNNTNYEQLFFNNILEKNLAKAVDVIIDGMRNDVLVMVKHCFHLDELVGRNALGFLPPHLTVPVLVFPY